MPLPSAIVSPVITGKLGGKPGLGELMTWLWPVDCQTCGRPLNGQDPSVCVDELGDSAVVTVHHQGCRTSVWNDSGRIPPGGNFVSYRTRLFLMPLMTGADRERMPTFILNPGLEYVVLHRDAGGTWHPVIGQPFGDAGLMPPGPDLILDQPVRGLSARLTRAGVSILLPRPSVETLYSCPFLDGDEPFGDEVRRRQGVMLAVTHAADPSTDPVSLVGQFEDALTGGRIMLGWVALADG